jgi:hypothetical protein
LTKTSLQNVLARREPSVVHGECPRQSLIGRGHSRPARRRFHAIRKISWHRTGSTRRAATVGSGFHAFSQHYREGITGVAKIFGPGKFKDAQQRTGGQFSAGWPGTIFYCLRKWFAGPAATTARPPDRISGSENGYSTLGPIRKRFRSTGKLSYPAIPAVARKARDARRDAGLPENRGRKRDLRLP